MIILLTFLKVLSRGVRDGYNVAKVEWIRDAEVPNDHLGNEFLRLFPWFTCIADYCQVIHIVFIEPR